MRWRKVTLVGVGLLGGSLGLALRRRGLAEQVHGYVRRPESVVESVAADAVDTASCDLVESIRGADLVVLCTPLAQMKSLALASLPATGAGTLVTDVGSVKGAIVAELEPLYASVGAFFVGSHPMAGSEKIGVGAAKEDLFNRALCVVTPTSRTDPEQTLRTERLWESVGAKSLRLTPEAHDELVARSSHLPHVLAGNLARYVLDPSRDPEQSQLCATGFRDSTRIASSSPEMWRDIVMMNHEPLKRAMREYQAQLRQFEELLETGDAEKIESFFRESKRLRDAWSSPCASRSPE